MLPRLLPRAAPRASCSTCHCACGSVFASPQVRGPGQTQSIRWIRYLKSPAVRARDRQSKAPVKGSARWTLQEVEKEESRDKARNFHKIWQRVGTLHHTFDQVEAFFNEFAGLVLPGEDHADAKKYHALRDKHGLSEDEMVQVCISRMYESHKERWMLGLKLLNTMSNGGNAEATIAIVSQALRKWKDEPNPFRRRTDAAARARLRQIADAGEDHRMMTLEAKVANQMHEDDHALKMWEGAMRGAVAATLSDYPPNGHGSSAEAQRREFKAFFVDAQLDSPWIDLTLYWYGQYQDALKRKLPEKAFHLKNKMRQYIEVGCALDDPVSHYHAAELLKDVTPDGDTRFTSSWLYHTTKAAASGHVKATYHMAEYYLESGWKYLEDEPPNEIKPTPFDSFPEPAPRGLESWKRVLRLPQVGTRPISKPSDAMFHLAAMPTAIHHRHKTALDWLEISFRTCYLPASLMVAKVILDGKVWGQSQTPIEAAQMSPLRYDYASEKDYLAGKRIVKNSKPPQDYVTPIKPDAARTHLQTVFLCLEAHRIVDRGSSPDYPSFRLPPDFDKTNDRVVARSMQKAGLGQRMWQWFAVPNVRELFVDDLPRLEREAKAICDKHGFDIFDEQGRLMYRSKKLSPKKHLSD